MYVLGHVGLTAGVVHWLDRRVDLRAAALIAMLPDVIDKPFRLFFPALVNRNTRGFGHTLVGAAVLLAALLALRRCVARPLLLWGCFVGHFALDRLWLHDDPRVLCWPFLGGFPPPVSDHETSLALWRYNIAGEAAGACVLALVLAARRRSAST